MNRGIRNPLLVGLVLFLPVLASCAGSPTAHVTPSPSPPAKAPVFANAGGPAVNLSRCAVGSQTEPIFTLGLKMTSPTTGWSRAQCSLGTKPSFPNGSTVQCYWPPSEFAGILRTQDGGKTWTDVSPPSVSNRTWHRAEFFLDATHAWVAEVSRTADACASQLTTFITSDGGRTWRQGGTIPIKTTTPTDEVFAVAGPADGMDFIDLQRGWLMLDWWPSNPQPDAPFASAMLYATSDGGMHWRSVASNPGRSNPGCQSFYAPLSDVSFMSATAGWFAVACQPGNPTVMTTRDGGVTWTPKPLPSCSCQVFRPAYVDADHAIITSEQGSQAMLATGDAGTTWSQRQVPAAARTEFSFIDPDHGWMIGIEQLPTSYDTVVYRTSDGGQSWQLLGKPPIATATSGPNLYYPIEALQFVDADTGFVVLGPEAGSQGGATDLTAPQLQIVSTVDGGRTWSVVLKQVPATPCVANYRNIGMGGGPLWPVKMGSPTVGWAKGGLRTTDGGAHWRDVSSPALREGSTTALYPPGYAEFYLDGEHAWQAGVYGANASCSDHVTIFATTDGGKTWQPSQPIALHLPARHQVGAMQMGFTSAQSGWLWLPTGPQSDDQFSFQAAQALLYVTSDGGLTWRLGSTFPNSQLSGLPVPTGSQGCTPSMGQATFSSLSTGWLSLNCSEVPMLVTRDGGSTWKAANFSVPGSVGCPCYFEQPKFADGSHGIVSVSGQKGLTGTTLLLTTTDGGTTWRQAGQPGTGFVLLVTFVGPSNLFALVTPPGWTKLSQTGYELHRSTDGGATWTLVQPKVPGSWPPGFLQFVDANHGWEANVNGATELLVTSDGGKTWRSIVPAIVS